MGKLAAMKGIEQKRVLVVDDDKFMRSVLRSLLQQVGMDAIEICESGQDGLGELRRAPGQYDVMLLDLEMPGTGGLDVLRELRQESDARLSRLPVIAITEHPDQENVLAARELKVVGIMAKSGLTAQVLQQNLQRALGVHG